MLLVDLRKELGLLNLGILQHGVVLLHGLSLLLYLFDQALPQLALLVYSVLTLLVLAQ